MDVFGTEGFDFLVLVECFVHHLDSYLRCFEHIERLHDNHIQQTVAHGGLRGDVGVVAVLGCIGTGNQESLPDQCSCLVFNMIGLRLIGESFTQYILDVGNRSALSGFGELHADERIEAHTASTEERYFVDDTVVEVVYNAAVDDLNALLRVHRQ